MFKPGTQWKSMLFKYRCSYWTNELLVHIMLNMNLICIENDFDSCVAFQEPAGDSMDPVVFINNTKDL